jgi:hypothetical protein
MAAKTNSEQGRVSIESVAAARFCPFRASLSLLTGRRKLWGEENHGFSPQLFFSAWAAESIAKDSTIRLPFGAGRTSPIDTRDVAEAIAPILASPASHIGKFYELTGPRSQDVTAHAAE